MLIRFVVENFKSFKEETDFNLLTGSVTKHGEHVFETKQGIEILPISIIYGGNASGKSNLIKAIADARRIITDGTHSKDDGFDVDKFAFDNSDSFNRPTKFEFEFKTEKEIYAYGVVFNHFEVTEEWLYVIEGKEKDKLLFKRDSSGITFSNELEQNEKDKQFLENEVRGLRKNQLFLTEAYAREVKFFDDAHEWFQHLLIIFPEQKFGKIHSLYDEYLLDFANNLLLIGDTGVSLEVRQVNYEKLISDNPDIRDLINKNLSVMRKVGLGVISTKGIVYSIFFNQDSQRNEAVKLMSIHPNKNYGNTLFETFMESDGTQRLIDLAGVLYPAIYKNKVVIIDEIDRSLHPLLAKKLIEVFLQKRIENGGTGQLICTTHEDLIIDMNLLRSDEVWFVQKNDESISEIYPLSDFNVDKHNIDIRMGYLNGRFGGIPQIKEKAVTR